MREDYLFNLGNGSGAQVHHFRDQPRRSGPQTAQLVETIFTTRSEMRKSLHPTVEIITLPSCSRLEISRGRQTT